MKHLVALIEAVLLVAIVAVVCWYAGIYRLVTPMEIPKGKPAVSHPFYQPQQQAERPPLIV